MKPKPNATDATSIGMLLLIGCLGLAVVAGCRHPVRALVGGGMKINGDMDLGGQMGVDGDIGMTGEVTTISKTDNTASPVRSVPVGDPTHPGGQTNSGARIAIVDVNGLIVDRNFTGFGSMGENPVSLFREKIRRIETDPTIAAVVLRIDTPGGGVTAADMLAHDVAELKRRRGIPVIACLMTTGCGGGYYLATQADQIVAHPTSVVGGIGVILNTYNMEDTLGQFNIISTPIKAGDKIDSGSPERMMEDDERELLQSMADQFHQRFIDEVRRSRGSRLADTDELFDGRVMTGSQAREAGLVDATGYLDDAVAMAGQIAGLGENADVVLLRRDNDRALSQYDITPNSPMTSLLPIKLPGLDRASMPTFLYLWQPEPTIASAGS